MSELVKRWYKVSFRDEYEIGPEFENPEKAERYRVECVDKQRRIQCRIVKYETRKEPW